jgi:hypothetical protein
MLKPTELGPVPWTYLDELHDMLSTATEQRLGLASAVPALPPDHAPRFASCGVSPAIETRFPHVDSVNADTVLVVNQSAAGEEEGHDDREGRGGCYHCCQLGTKERPTEHNDH